MKSLAFLLLLAVPLVAFGQRKTGVTKFYVSPRGNDSNACISKAAPCKTINAAYTKMIVGYDFRGMAPTIHLADGTYPNTAVDATEMPIGAHAVTIEGNCGGSSYGARRNKVIVIPKSGQAAFWAQDGATLIVNCMQIGGAPDGVAIQCRQHVIIDADFLNFTRLSAGIMATDHCIVNVGGDNQISGDMTVFVSANYHSTIRFTGPNEITKPVKIDYFVQSYNKSIVEYVERWINPQYVSGSPYHVWRGGSFAANGKAMPGNGSGTNLDSSGYFYK